ncbi:MAG: 4Fe-4S dicluster domain-containing protein [Propionicimonas sp.]
MTTALPGVVGGTPDPSRQLLRWLMAHDLPDRALLLCQDTPSPGGERHSLVVRAAGCLAELSIGLPAQLLACGIGEVAVLSCAGDAAAVRSRVAQWRRVIHSGLELLDEAPPPSRWRRPPEELVLGAIPVSRRTLLGLGGGQGFPLDPEADATSRTLTALAILQERGQAAPVPAAPPVPPVPVEPGHADAGAVSTEADEVSPARALQITGCTACGVCVQACPHDAMLLRHAAQASTLSHLRENCRGELACLRLCPVGAITDGGVLALQEIWREPRTVVARVRTTTCPRCRARHPGRAGSLCAACEFRSRNPFGSALPPRPPSRNPGNAD